MPAPPDQPESWIEDAPNEGWGSGDGWTAGDEVYGTQTTAWDAPRPMDNEPDASAKAPRRWLRWAAVAAGLVVIAGIVVWQGRSNKTPDSADRSVANSTWAPPTPIGTDPTTPASEPSPSSDTFEVAIGRGGNASDPMPTTAVRLPPLPLENATWELVGYGPEGLLRYTPATGQLVITPLPAMSSGGPLSFAVLEDAALLRPMDFVTGYVVKDGQAAEPLAGALADSTLVLPSPDDDHVWALTDMSIFLSSSMPPGLVGGSGSLTDDAGNTVGSDGTGLQPLLVSVDGQGNGGSFMEVPANTVGGVNPAYAIHPDGAGYALFDGMDGVYHLGPDGTHLVTHGQVLATGPAAVLLYECDDQATCSLVVVDRLTGEHRPLPAATTDLSAISSSAPGGVTSPDGVWAAIRDPNTSAVTLVDLLTGAMTIQPVGTGPGTSFTTTAANLLAFSPDSRYLLMALNAGTAVIDTVTGRMHGLLPVPPLDAITVRATH